MHLLLYTACTSEGLPEKTDTGDAWVDTAGEDSESGEPVDTTGLELHGTAPDEALPAPEFSATNRDGTPRSQVDLVGHPTLMWFYPAAATGG